MHSGQVLEGRRPDNVFQVGRVALRLVGEHMGQLLPLYGCRRCTDETVSRDTAICRVALRIGSIRAKHVAANVDVQ